MHHRFVLGLTQERTAERLDLSVRHLNRAQREATHVLARLLWEQHRTREESMEGPLQEPEVEIPNASEPGPEPTGWLPQVRRELLALQTGAPDAETDVEATIHGVVRIAHALSARRGVEVRAAPIQRELLAIFHPTALREVLLAAVTGLLHNMSSGAIDLRAEPAASRVRITISASPLGADWRIDDSLVQEILSAHGGFVERSTAGNAVSLTVDVPSVRTAEQQVTVLVVDDNPDLISLYESYCVGTPYEIVHVPQGQRAVSEAEAIRPDIVVLDVLLPDVDGWDLLVDLHAHPRTRSIPVVVCSVIKEKELAAALGAALYLPKPVWREAFIDGLDRALNQAAAGASPDRASS